MSKELPENFNPICFGMRRRISRHIAIKPRCLIGEVLEHTNIHQFWGDLVLLHSLGCRLVIVHGSRPQIDKALAQRG